MQADNLAALRQLSTQQLDQLLQETEDPETVRHILTVLQEREKDLPITITDGDRLAWQRYKLREKEGADKPAKKRSWILRVASVAAVLCVLMVAMVYSVEAGGFWERVSRWTDSVIEFFSPDHSSGGQQPYEFKTNHQGLQQVYDAAKEIGITAPVVPMWLPDEYELIFCQDMRTHAQTTLVAIFQSGENVVNYNLSVYSDRGLNQYQKDEAEVKEVEIQGVNHYIVRNTDAWVAVWAKDNIECSISVNCQEDDLYKILRSIYDKEEA